MFFTRAKQDINLVFYKLAQQPKSHDRREGRTAAALGKRSDRLIRYALAGGADIKQIKERLSEAALSIAIAFTLCSALS